MHAFHADRTNFNDANMITIADMEIKDIVIPIMPMQERESSICF